jgi:hypothetical protein
MKKKQTVKKKSLGEFKYNKFIDKYISTYPWLKDAIYVEQVDMHLVVVDPSLLKANPKNWRTHSSRQRTTFNSFKDKYGWLNLIIFNLQSGKLLDGHMRTEEAIKNNELVPIRIVDLNEEEENEVLATYDNIGLMATRNNQALQSLINSVNTEHLTRAKTQVEARMQQVRNDLQSAIEELPTTILPQSKKRVKLKKEEPEEDAPEEPRERSAFRTTIDTSVIFSGETDLCIPTFLPEKFCAPEDAPRKTYHGDESTREHYYCYSQTFYDELQIGTVGFYTEDYKFENTYDNPDDFLEWALEVNPVALITPDFSSYTIWPMVKNLWALYRSRWVGRLWQEAGLNIIPTVQILDSSYEKTMIYVLETLPLNCPTLAIECRLDSPKDSPKLVKWINTIVDTVKPECMVLYAGQEKQKYIHGDLHRKKQTDYRYLPQIITAKNERKKRRK